ncbi:MAG: TPR end-of-group domain-containing protein [Candidatus Dormibacterales bacterium]
MKQKLLELIKAGRSKEESELVPHVDDTPPAQAGAWTTKDQLAHLMAWRRVAIAEINAVRGIGVPPAASNDDAIENARIYEETRDQPAAAILEAGRSSWDELTAAVEACTEEDLLKPRTRRPEPLWREIPNNTCFHVGDHLVYWHQDRGEEAAAERAAGWAHHLAMTMLPDDQAIGVAAYNFGCFFAKRGRVFEAMPHLRQGIELRPDLRDWARQDADLDPIRSEPELEALLAER